MIGRKFSAEDSKSVILIIVGCLLVIGIAVALNQITFVRFRSDLYLRWYASQKLLQEGRNIYDPTNATEVLAEVYGDEPPLTTNFYYPAHLLVFVGPLALLPYPVAHLLWTILIQLFYLLGLWLVMRAVNWPGSANQTALFLGAAFLLIPNIQHTIWAQFNTIGVLGLASCYVALRRGRYGLAGFLATGMTFKPQAMVLTLCFFLMWALAARRRWRFYVGFAAAGILLWLVSELLQPQWVFDFIDSLDYYVPVQSVIDGIWNPGQLLSGLLVIAAFGIFLRNLKAPAVSVAMAGCLVFSLAIWALVVPIVGMMHIVLMPIAAILVMAGLKMMGTRLYRYVGFVLILLYGVGWVGFLLGFSSILAQDSIYLAELIYKILLPMFVAVFSLRLCFGGRGLTLNSSLVPESSVPAKR